MKRLSMLLALCAPAGLAQSIDPPMPHSPAPSPVVFDNAPTWRLGLGGRIPDGLVLEASRRFTPKHHARFSLGLPVEYVLGEKQDAESDSFFGAVTIVTPPQAVDVAVLYGPTLALDYLYFPSTKGFFAAAGLLYYTANALSEKSSQLYICVENPDSCEAATADFVTTGKVHVKARLRTKGYKARVGAGWRFEPSERVYIDLTGIGLAYTLQVQRTADVSSSLDDDPALTSLSKEQAVYVLERKEKKLEDRARSRMEQVDRKLLPYAGVVAGYAF